MQLKVASNGTKIWEHSIPGSQGMSEHRPSITEIPAGGYLIVGEFSSNNMMTKLSTGGDVLFSKTLGVSLSAGKFYDVIPSGDGGFLLAGYGTNQYGEISGRLMKVDENGRFISSLQFGGQRRDKFFSVCPTNDGHFIAAGATLSGNEDGTFHHGQTYDDAWLMKVKVN